MRRRWPDVGLGRITIVSVGTTSGSARSAVSEEDAGDWGLKRWIASPPLRIVKLTLRAQTDFTVEAMDQLGLAAFRRMDAGLGRIAAQHEIDLGSLALDLDNARPEALAMIERIAELRRAEFSEEENAALRLIAARRRWVRPPLVPAAT